MQHWCSFTCRSSLSWAVEAQVWLLIGLFYVPLYPPPPDCPFVTFLPRKLAQVDKPVCAYLLDVWQFSNRRNNWWVPLAFHQQGHVDGRSPLPGNNPVRREWAGDTAGLLTPLWRRSGAHVEQLPAFTRELLPWLAFPLGFWDTPSPSYNCQYAALTWEDYPPSN